VGAAIGAVVGLVAAASAIAAAPLVRRRFGSARPRTRAAVAATATALSVAAFVTALAAWTARPVTAFAVLALPGTLAAAACAATKSSLRRALAAVTAVAVGLGAMAGLGVPGACPDAVCPAERRSDDLLVLCWNCGLGNPGSFHSRPEDLPAIARTIAASEAHVACLQEVGDAHRDALIALLGPPWRGVSNEPGNGWGDSVLTRVGGELETRVLPDLFRGTAVARVTCHGRSLALLSVHLSPGAASTWRLAQAESLREHARTANHAVLVAGDVNVDPRSPWDRLLGFFSDSIARDREVERVLGAIGADAGEAAAATATLSRRLDRVYVPAGWTTVEFRVLHGHKIGRMDHHPILVRIRPE